MTEKKEKWTNPTLVAYLKQIGYLQDPEPIAIEETEGTLIAMNRLHERILVFLPSALKMGEEPRVYIFDSGNGGAYDFKRMSPVDPRSLGVRNSEIQNDGSPDE